MKILVVLIMAGGFCFGQPKTEFLKFDRAVMTDTICKSEVDLSKNKAYFTFTNHGKKPIIITKVQSGDPDFACYFPRDPIKPAAKDSIGICMVEQQLKMGMNRWYYVEYFIAGKTEMHRLPLQLRRIVINCKKD